MSSLILGFVAICLLVAAIFLAMRLARYAIARALGVNGIGIFSGKPTDVVPGRAIAAIAVGSVSATYALAASLFVAGYMSGGVPSFGTVINAIPGRAAALAGMRDGDRVLSVAGTRVETWEALAAAIRVRSGQPTAIVVARAGAEIAIEVTPSDGKIGIRAVPSPTDLPFSTALARGIAAPARTLADVARGVRAVTSVREEKELSGPVGIVAATADVSTNRVANLLLYLGSWGAFLFLPIGLISLRDLTGNRRSSKPIRGSSA